MRFLIIGAGAVGVTLGVHLEHKKHDVLYLVRPGRKQEMERFLIVDAKSGKPHKRERPNVAEAGAELPPYEWALLCVRGDQVEAAFATARAHLRPDARIGLAAATLTPPDELRRLWPGGPVFSILPLFAAWSEEKGVWRWFQQPFLKTLVSGEGEPRADEAAREFAAALVDAGLPARAVPSLRRSAVPLLGPGLVLLAGWQLAGWDLDRFGGDRALRRLTAEAMAEAARAFRAEAEGPMRLLSYAPAGALDLMIRALPRLTPGDLRQMWSHHGPKIQEQTRTLVDAMLARAGDAAPKLRELRARLA